MDDDVNVKFEFFFDDDMTTFTIYLEAAETLEVNELADAIIDFGRKVRSGEVMMYGEDEVSMH